MTNRTIIVNLNFFMTVILLSTVPLRGKEALAMSLMCFYPLDFDSLQRGGGGATQNFVWYECAAGNFDYHPIAKPQTNQICKSYSNQIFCFTLRSINFRTNLLLLLLLLLFFFFFFVTDP